MELLIAISFDATVQTLDIITAILLYVGPVGRGGLLFGAVLSQTIPHALYITLLFMMMGI